MEFSLEELFKTNKRRKAFMQLVEVDTNRENILYVHNYAELGKRLHIGQNVLRSLLQTAVNGNVLHNLGAESFMVNPYFYVNVDVAEHKDSVERIKSSWENRND